MLGVGPQASPLSRGIGLKPLQLPQWPPTLLPTAPSWVSPLLQPHVYNRILGVLRPGSLLSQGGGCRQGLVPEGLWAPADKVRMSLITQ